MKIILRKTLRDLRQNLAQSIALITVVALGVASFIALIGAYRDLGTSYQHTYDRLNFADVTFGLDAAPDEVLDEVRAVDGVEAVSGRLIVDTGYELPEDAVLNAGEPIRTRLIGIPAGEHPAVNDVLVMQGDYLPASDGRTALLETHFADIYELGPGDSVTPLINGEEVTFEVSGVAASPEYLIVSPSRQDILPSARSFAVLFVPLAELQTLSGQENTVNSVAVRVAADADRDAVVADIKTLLEPYGLETTTPREDQPSNAALQLDLEGYREIAVLMPGLILFVAAISVYVMLGRQVRAQRPQIGLMKALGYRNGAVIGHYMLLALIIAVVGLLAGTALGIPLERGITKSYAIELGIPLVETQFYPDLVGIGALLSLLVALFAGLGPSRRSAQIEPARAMRQDPAEALISGRRSLIERLVRLPLWLRLTLRNVFRVRRRSITTALGIIFAYMLVLMSWGMLDSMRYMLDHQFQDVERWDVMISFDNPQMQPTLDTITDIDGVETVQPLAQLPATLIHEGQEGSDVLLTAFNPAGQNLHHLDLPDGERVEAALAERQMVITRALADKHDLATGDRVTVDTPFGEKELTVGGISEELMGAAVYVNMDTVQDWIGTSSFIFNGAYLNVEAGQADRIQEELYRLPGAASVQIKQDIRADWQSLMGLFYAFMGVMLLFAGAMAFALLFNAMTVNVLERQREFATMRAFGTGRRRLARMMTAENLILWLLTLAPGLLLGHWVAAQLGAAFQSELFAFTVRINPSSTVITALSILLTMLLATLPPMRRVNRLNLAEATKMLT